MGITGLLVGFGSRLGGGCTSGHGLCGLPRRSPRSIAAISTFMTTGAVAAYLSRSEQLLKPLLYVPYEYAETDAGKRISHFTAAALVNFFSWAYFGSTKSRVDSPQSSGVTVNEHIASFASGLLFGLGLGISGMWFALAAV